MAEVKQALETRKHTAYHEAGHVVTAIVLGRPFTSVHLDHDGGALKGTQIDFEKMDRRSIADVGLIAASGAVAEDSIQGRKCFSRSSDDHALILRLCRFVGESENDFFYQRAQEILLKHWKKVSAIANALQARGFLTYNECVTIFNQK